MTALTALPEHLVPAVEAATISIYERQLVNKNTPWNFVHPDTRTSMTRHMSEDILAFLNEGLRTGVISETAITQDGVAHITLNIPLGSFAAEST